MTQCLDVDWENNLLLTGSIDTLLLRCFVEGLEGWKEHYTILLYIYIFVCWVCTSSLGFHDIVLK